MRAARIHRFGASDAIVIEELPRPEPREGEVLVRINAAGVGPWDALIREGNSAVAGPAPLTLGSDFSGIVESVGREVSQFKSGDHVYGATNPQFIGAYAEYACASAGMIARKPEVLSDVEAASVPVVAVTAWQMLFEYAHAVAGQTVLIHGGAGSVGAYAVQLAKLAGIHVIATASARDAEYVRGLGADSVPDYRTTRFEDAVTLVDAVLDMVGGEVRERSLPLLGSKGILVSAAAPIPEDIARRYGNRVIFFYVEVTTARLNAISDLFESGKLHTDIGTVLSLNEARRAHEMLAGAPHPRGKIVLKIAP